MPSNAAHKPSRSRPAAGGRVRRLILALCAVAAILFFTELAVMQILPVLGLEGLREDAADSLLLALLVLGPLYALRRVWSPSLEEENKGSGRLFRSYLLASAGAMTTIGLFIGLSTHLALMDCVMDEAEDDATEVAAALCDGPVKTQLGCSAVDGGLAVTPQGLPELDRNMRAFLVPFGIVKINVFDRNRRIIYSTDRGIVGRPAAGNPMLDAALEGRIGSKLQSGEALLDASEEQRPDADVVVTHVPIADADGQILGSLEIRKDVTDDLAAGEASWRRSLITLLVVLLAAFGALSVIMYQADRVIRRHGAALERSRDELLKLSTAIEQSPATIVITDIEGTIEYVNPRFTEVTGYAAEEAIGQNPRILKSGRRPKKEYEALWDTILSGKVWRGEFENKKKNGELYWETASISPIRNADGVITHFLAVKEDITERKRSQEALAGSAMALQKANLRLRAACEQAEEANRAKSTFLANMSHEIRTPMTAILGYAEVLMDEVECCETCPAHAHCEIRLANKERVKTIQRNAVTLLEILDEVLDLSKIEAGRFEIEQAPCRLPRLLSDLRSLMRGRAEAKGLSIEITCEGPIPETIRTDSARLRKILVNLVGNAIKFTKTGGVRVVTRLIRDSNNRALMGFDVVDTGIGISKAQAERIFEPFTQADASTTRRFGGTGLGLTISRHFARLLGGDLVVAATEVGAGCTFRATVDAGPLDGVKMLDDPFSTPDVDSEDAEGAGRGGVPRAEARGSSGLDCRILLAEDGPDNQRLISFILKKAGADVTVVENGQLAVEQAMGMGQEDGDRNAAPPFDIILMDMQMPVMDGYEATRTLRRRGYRGPIIALTAHAMRGDREKCLSAGCDDYTTKPIDRKKLIEMIRTHLRSEAVVGSVG